MSQWRDLAEQLEELGWLYRDSGYITAMGDTFLRVERSPLGRGVILSGVRGRVTVQARVCFSEDMLAKIAEIQYALVASATSLCGSVQSTLES